MVGLTASALIGVMNPVLTKLIELSGNKSDNFKDVQKKIAKLQLELSSMKTALEKVCESDEASSDVEERMHQLREVSYDVEDCIEIFVHRLNHGDSTDGFIQHTIRKLSILKARYRIGNTIKELMARVEEVSHRHNRYKDISSTSKSTIDPRLRAVFEEANRLVGIDSQRDTVAASLTDCIVGLHPQSSCA
jgi:DNA repair ATPase RecN